MSQILQLTPDQIFAAKYRVVRRLSGGGMGNVYVVEHTFAQRLFALKLMHPHLVRDPRMRAKFEQEARVSARIVSDHVVQVVDAGVDEEIGIPWLVMELLEGEDLEATLQRRGILPFSEVAAIFLQLGHALNAAHTAGIVHRDLKPDNIFLARSRSENGQVMVKVLDFGIARVIEQSHATGTMPLGTPLWMAPEQTDPNHDINARADIWPLGLLGFYLLTGKQYWRVAQRSAPAVSGWMRESMVEPLVRASQRAQELGCDHRLPAGFDSWFARCVTREIGQRFADAQYACTSLAALSATSFQSVRSPAMLLRITLPVAALILALSGGIGYRLWQGRKPPVTPQPMPPRPVVTTPPVSKPPAPPLPPTKQELCSLSGAGKSGSPAMQQEACKSLCQEGELNVCRELRDRLKNGDTDPGVLFTAVEQLCAKGKEGEACEKASSMLREGIGTKKDIPRAQELHKQACQRNKQLKDCRPPPPSREATVYSVNAGVRAKILFHGPPQRSMTISMRGLGPADLDLEIHDLMGNVLARDTGSSSRSQLSFMIPDFGLVEIIVTNNGPGVGRFELQTKLDAQ